MTYQDILFEAQDGVATITINRPQVMNAFRGQTCEELIHALNRAGWDKAIGVIVLMLLYPALPLPRIVAADIAHAVPLTLVAGMGHAWMGSVDWMLLAKLLAGSIPGIWLGTLLMRKTPDRVIRSLLSVLLAYAGLKLIAI